MNSILVSFIIPHKGRDHLLERTIQSIFDQDFDLNSIEIIIATQNRMLRLRQITAPQVANFKTLFCSECSTIAALRNQGASHASGHFLAFIDADIQLSSNWLRTMLSELSKIPGRALVSACQTCGPDDNAIERIIVLLNQHSVNHTVDTLSGKNLFMTSEAFSAAGRFPEYLSTCEDYYFTSNVNKLGYLYLTSRASFVHLGEDKTYRDLFHKEIWRARSNLLSLRARKISLKEFPSIVTPLWQMFLFIAFAATLFLKYIIPSMLCLILFFLPSVCYSLRLYRIGRTQISVLNALCFYLVYHAARMVGTIAGIWAPVSSKRLLSIFRSKCHFQSR